MFSKIVCLDNTNLTEDAYEAIDSLASQSLARSEELVPEDLPGCEDADVALVSWRTRVDEAAMKKYPSLKYIGLCASKYTNPKVGNIDLEAATKLGITVTAVGQYGDEATAEYIFCMLMNLCRGFGKAQWKESPCELYGKKLGIIGMGAMGKEVLRLGLGFGMEMYYFSRTRKPEVEDKGCKFVEKKELLEICDIVTLHVPKGITIMDKSDFSLMKTDAILINTSGVVLDPDDFDSFIKCPTNFSIMDECADQTYHRFKSYPNVIFPDVVAGRTSESRARLSEQVLGNLKAYLEGKNLNVIN